MKQFDFITIFPKIFESYLSESIMKRAKEAGAVNFVFHDLRDWSTNKHRNIDDTPYGGGAGMVMQVEPVYNCVNAIKLQAESCKLKPRVILLSAKGKRFTQADARRLSAYDQLVFICGRYEGVDERIAEHVADEEISIGDFVLTGGELPAMIITDSIVRLIPDVLGNEQSIVEESHSVEGYLEYPQYTKPEEFHGWKVPEVLLSGNHAEIEKWRREHSKNK